MRMKYWFARRLDGRSDRRAGHSVRCVDGARAAGRPAVAVSEPRSRAARSSSARANAGKAPANQAPPPPQVAISVQSNIVDVDAVVTDHDGNIVTGLKKENFRILDEGQRQQIANFAPTDAPITIVMLMEFSARYGGYFGYKAKYWSQSFLTQLKPQDWVALKTFDLKTTLVEDFTQDKRQVEQDIESLFFPSFSEANLFDAVLETMGQLRDVKGKKAILVLATGFDTFSKHNLDETLRRVKETDVTIFCVGVGEGSRPAFRGRGRHRLPAGEESTQHVRSLDRRIRMVPAIPRRDARDLQFRGAIPAQPVHAGVFAVYCAGREIPQAPRASGGR